MKTLFAALTAALALTFGTLVNAAPPKIVMEEFMVPAVDPGQIRVPTFLAHAEWDADLPSYMLHAYFAKLINAPYKRYVEIGEGTHTVIMEKNRMQLFTAVQQFLDEKIKAG